MGEPAADGPGGSAALDGFYGALLEDDAESLYERAPCGYLSTAPDGTIIKVNGTFLTWTGYRSTDLVGRRTFAHLLSAGGRIYHETHYAPMLRMQDKVREIAFDIVCSDGRRLPALVNSVLERDPGGEPVVIRTAIFDATERREYERELVRAKRRAEESEIRAQLLARTLQQTLIPPAPPAVPGLDVAAVYRPAGSGDEIGGDFYDVFEVGGGDWIVAVGDVCGKGVDAAVVTAAARYTIRGTAIREPDLRQVLEGLNRVLLGHESDRFCTVALLRLTEAGGRWRVTVSSGGHPLPVLLRDGTEPQVVGRAGSLLGVLPSPSFYETELALQPGDALVLYTDGVTEGRSGKEFYGEDRLEDSAGTHRSSATALAQGVLDDVMRFQAGEPRDDIVVVAVRVPARDSGG